MTSCIHKELAKFESYLACDNLGGYSVQRVDKWGFTLTPESHYINNMSDLTLIALNHGDEVGGIAVLNRLCEQISTGALKLDVSMTFLLCNVEAAINGQRFLERDLNRSYASQNIETQEQKRAKEIEPLLSRSKFILDFHQTIEPTSTAFFVYHYNPKAALFAHYIDPKLPVITHKESTSAKMGGMRCDEFATQQGCIAIALELSQKGFDEAGISLGIAAACRAITAVSEWESVCLKTPKIINPMWTWAHIESYPKEYIALKPGLKNFEFVKQGEVVGLSGSGVELKIAMDGALLFPKYIQPGDKKPVEIFRLLKEVTYFEPKSNGLIEVAQ